MTTTINDLEKNPFMDWEKVPLGVLEEWLDYNVTYVQEHGTHNMGPNMICELRSYIRKRKNTKQRPTDLKREVRKLLVKLVLIAVGWTVFLIIFVYALQVFL